MLLFLPTFKVKTTECIISIQMQYCQQIPCFNPKFSQIGHFSDFNVWFIKYTSNTLFHFETPGAINKSQSRFLHINIIETLHNYTITF